MSDTTVRYAVESGIARVVLNRPERLNAFNAAMHGELREALARAPGDGARALVITGAGRGFCAGQDLGERQPEANGPRADLGDSIERHYKPLILALRALPLPTIAAVNGVAAGAGASLALACDVAIAARSASFVQAFSKLGLVPDSGATWFLPRVAGPARALALAWLAEKLDAATAADWGLIWRCVDDAEFPAAVDALAARLAAGPTRALVRTREAMDAAWSRPLAAQLDLERDLQRELGRTDDYAEGVAAFAGKRAPRFRGG